MAKHILNEIVQRAIADAAFRDALQRRPQLALGTYSLTAAEVTALTSRDPDKLTALGVDRRLSKAFALGLLGDASKSVRE